MATILTSVARVAHTRLLVYMLLEQSSPRPRFKVSIQVSTAAKYIPCVENNERQPNVTANHQKLN